MNKTIEKIGVGAADCDGGITGFSVDDLLEAIWTPPPEPEKNSSYPSTVYHPLEAAKACTFIPD